MPKLATAEAQPTTSHDKAAKIAAMMRGAIASVQETQSVNNDYDEEYGYLKAQSPLAANANTAIDLDENGNVVYEANVTLRWIAVNNDGESTLSVNTREKSENKGKAGKIIPRSQPQACAFSNVIAVFETPSGERQVLKITGRVHG